ncbi:glycosyltransferase BC10-like [Cornus florida]|uniref:glycosyltransferase BC10-like n=1 Tax=Cornus florida TaxID=4283 RepID=UPI0028963ED4|nr:glycosyltransferase BC10-like [Cornus florida]
MKSREMKMGDLKDAATLLRASHSRFLPLRILQSLLMFLGASIVFSIGSMYMIRYFGEQNVVVPFVQTSVQTCIEEANTIKKWIRPPTSLKHTMNDAELYWRASFAPRRKAYPFKRTGKIAFMFLTRGPLPLAPLWDRFFKGHNGHYSVYIHSLPSYIPDFPPSSAFYGRQIPSQVAEWGMMSMCNAERRLLANALLDISNEWFILVSEACIPVQDFKLVYRHISKSKHSFIGAMDEPGPYGRGRYNKNMAPEVNLTEWRKGSQWFEVNRKLAVDIIQDSYFYPKFEQFCKPDCYVDEHYFPTMLSMQSPHLLANRTLTWVDWSRGGPHPATFGKDDVTEEFFKNIIEGSTCSYNDRPTSICFLFARKFSPDALDRLLELAPKVFHYW